MMKVPHCLLRRIVRACAFSAACLAIFLLAYDRFTAWYLFKPNVILITSDSLRPDHLGCYGYMRATSPDIDRIASEGVIFTNTVTPGSWTMPSIPSLMTSTHPRVHRVMLVDRKLPSRLPLLAEVVRDAGFTTAAFVNHLWLGTTGPGVARGFDTFDNSYALNRAQVAHHEGDSLLTDDLINWLDRNGGKRVFVWAHYMNPHYPYTPPPPQRDLFDDDGLYETGRQAPVSSTPFLFGAIRDTTTKPMQYPNDVDHYVSRYDAEIRCVNNEVRRIVRYLDAAGLRRRTVLIVSADHGESLGENDWYFEHNKPYETVIRVPLIFQGYGIRPSRPIPALVSLLDLAPTILDILDLPVPESFEGRSILPLVEGRAKEIRTYAYGGDPWSQDYIWTQSHKLLVIRPTDENLKHFGLERKRRGIPHFFARMFRWGAADAEPEAVEVARLHNLAVDPGETVDLSHAEPELAAHLRSLLDHHIRGCEHKGEILKDGSANTVGLDEKTTAFLRALGYI